MFDLENFREKILKMNQSEFANLIGLQQHDISRIEKRPEKISLEILLKIASATGSTLDELIKLEPIDIEPINVKDTWKEVNFIKKIILDSILENKKNDFTQEMNTKIKELERFIKQRIVKPKIAVIGHSDVGKSKFINSIIGVDSLPVSWTPTTSIAIYIKHIDDRPSYLKDDVLVFDNLWDSNRLDDVVYCESCKLTSGSVDILNAFGTRQGKHFDTSKAVSAVIFLKSDILKNCDIVDLPGFKTGDRIEDENIPLEVKQHADIIIFMSHAGQFLQESGIEYLKNTINTIDTIEKKDENALPPLGNLFIVASQAHTINKGNEEELKKIMDRGCDRLIKALPENYWEDKTSFSNYKYDLISLRKRFFTYSIDIESSRDKLEKELVVLIEKLPSIIYTKAIAYMNDFVEISIKHADQLIADYRGVMNENDKYKLLLAQIEQNEPKRIYDNELNRYDMNDKIQKISENSSREFKKAYDELISKDTIVGIIKEKKWTKAKEDIEALVGYVNTTLQIEYQKILQIQSEKLGEYINHYLINFDNSLVQRNGVSDIKLSFDSKRAFASGLAGTAAFGGMAFWAASLGNLGAYILVAKGVSILAAVGIHIGGVSVATAAIAALGGPIVLGVALAILIAGSVFFALSGKWEEKVAKKIVEQYTKENAFVNFDKSIQLYWTDTKNAFKDSAGALEQEWKKYIENLKEMLSNTSFNEIESKIRKIEEFKEFIQNIMNAIKQK